MSAMTSRERVQCVLNGGKPDRVPFNFWMDRDIMAKLDEKWGADFRLTHYGVDVIEAFALLPFWWTMPPKMVHDAITSWQVEPIIDDLRKALDLPLPNQGHIDAITQDIEAKRAANPDKAIFALTLAPLEIIFPLRLMEGVMMDMLDYPEVLHELLGRYRNVMIPAMEKVCQSDIDVLYVAGDICSVNGPMISPKLLREFHFEYMKDFVQIAHAAGKKCFYHTDGRQNHLWPMFMEYGFDGVNPVEARYHDYNDFVADTQGKLTLYGGLDNCNIIPNGTVDEVRAQVRSVFDIVGKDGGLILSSHDIPSCVPMENLDAMVDEIKSCTY